MKISDSDFKKICKTHNDMIKNLHKRLKIVEKRLNELEGGDGYNMYNEHKKMKDDQRRT